MKDEEFAPVVEKFARAHVPRECPESNILYIYRQRLVDRADNCYAQITTKFSLPNQLHRSPVEISPAKSLITLCTVWTHDLKTYRMRWPAPGSCIAYHTYPQSLPLSRDAAGAAAVGVTGRASAALEMTRSELLRADPEIGLAAAAVTASAWGVAGGSAVVAAVGVCGGAWSRVN